MAAAETRFRANLVRLGDRRSPENGFPGRMGSLRSPRGFQNLRSKGRLGASSENLRYARHACRVNNRGCSTGITREGFSFCGMARGMTC